MQNSVWLFCIKKHIRMAFEFIPDTESATKIPVHQHKTLFEKYLTLNYFIEIALQLHIS